MDKFFWFIIVVILILILVQILIKITSLVFKIFLWLIIGFLFLYLANYLILPMVSIKSFPIKEFIYKKIINKDINNIDKKIQKEIKFKLKSIIDKIAATNKKDTNNKNITKN